MVQPYGTIVKLPIALSEATCRKSVENLKQVLADTITLRDLYKKHHWHLHAHEILLPSPSTSWTYRWSRPTEEAERS
ncbi:MAG TPA: hypothetical protein VF173_04925 [Thermoanaerobaculia bacterium]|nr:hypothetical protein [Thermoanaerobaculia bacterium]